jgi:hypothetical protein
MTVITAGSAPTTDIFQSQGDKTQARQPKVCKNESEQKEDSEVCIPIQSPCKSDNGDMKGIQRVIKNLQNDIERIKRFSNINSAFDALTNEDVEPWKSIKKVINFSASDIAGYVKNIMGRVRGWVMNTIQNRAKEILPFLFPGEMPSFLDKLGKGVNGLSCAFAKIIRGLAKTVGNLLLQMLDKFINGPMCLAESFVNNLLNQILGPIESAIGSALSLINGALSQVAGLANSLFNALDFVTGILNFFKCDDDKACPSVQEISLSGAGQNSPPSGDPVDRNPKTPSSSPSDGKPTTGDNVTTAGQSNGNANAAQDVKTAENPQDALQKQVGPDGKITIINPRTPEQQREITGSLDII